MAKKAFDVVATTGTYQSGGQEKKRYTTCGAAFTDDQGRISIKLETVPVGPGWSGWLSLYPVKEDGRRAQPAARNAETYKDGDGSEIPF